MDWTWLSVEYLRPNFPLSRDWKSSLLLLMTLHINMYLKQRMALLSFAALNKRIHTWGVPELNRSRNKMFYNPGPEHREYQTWDLFLQWCSAGSKRCWRWLSMPWVMPLLLHSSWLCNLFCSRGDRVRQEVTCRQLFLPILKLVLLFSFLCRVLRHPDTDRPASVTSCVWDMFFSPEHTIRLAIRRDRSEAFMILRPLRYSRRDFWLSWRVLV